MHLESPVRSVLKALSYRVWGTLATAGLVYVLSRQWKLALAVGGLEAAAKVVIYFLHERAWNVIRFGRVEVAPCVVWFTGLPASGKSTLARRLMERLRAEGLRAEHLDGDEIRHLFPDTGYSREARETHVRRVGLLARYLQRNGVFVAASLISPYAASRRFVRELCGDFIEVHVATPLAECEKRDPKGLYARARRGELRNFTGVDDPFEAPEAPELRIDASVVGPDEAVELVLARIKRRSRSRP